MLQKLFTKLKGSRISKPIRLLRTELLIRRYWRGLLQSIKEQNHSSILSENRQPPGIAFSFDDSFRIHDWYKYGKDLFGFYDVKVTFNMNAFHHFEGQREHTQEEIDKLIELQAQGHELAHHGYTHREAVAYSNDVGIDGWIHDEILPLFDWLKQQVHSKTNQRFKTPVTFAYPYTAYNKQTNDALVPHYFKIVRGGCDMYQLPKAGHTGYTPSICIDRNHLFKMKYFKKAMKLAKQTRTNLIVMCHSILPDDEDWEAFGWGEDSKTPGEYRTSPERLQAIIAEAKREKMSFYTTAEIAGVATFIDQNLENYIREEVIKTSEKWIMIDELHSIKTLDLRQLPLTSLGGIEYFINLERIKLGEHNLSDLKLLNKLPKLKWVELNNFIESEGVYDNLAKYRMQD